MKLSSSLICLLFLVGCSLAPTQEGSPHTFTFSTPEILEEDERAFFALLGQSESDAESAIQTLEKSWDDGLAVILLEALLVVPGHRRKDIVHLLDRVTGQKSDHQNEWFAWYWNQEKRPPAWYPNFKATMYSAIDPSFGDYFGEDRKAIIDLTEIRWGGVRRDGIPPLDHPRMLEAKQADYLNNTDVVFGIIHSGDARAYPKRILAWHEMFRDEIGGASIAGVYCTLCGTMIPYLSEDYVIGTSGFLYRSNKLMYDLKTRSLWSTTDGRPVVGPLVGQDIKLKSLAVVTTTWGEWKKRHPNTTVLSLDTGHQRNYDEGAAYSHYFSNDKLMFNTPKIDTRLANKAEVLLPGFPGEPMAIDSSFLKKNPIYQDQKGDINFVVLTDTTGANRMYESKGLKFSDHGVDEVIDQSGGIWQIFPDHLLGTEQQKLRRLPAHRAFWFGWYAAHPETRLVQ